MKTFVISLGGSIVVPDLPDHDFLQNFSSAIISFLSDRDETRIIFVVGGGATARKYQNAARATFPNISDDALDWIGIRSTHLNAEMVNSVFGSRNPIVTSPFDDSVVFDGKILVAGGWKPGFSTDTDSVYLATRFSSSIVINLSNTDYVYTSNPKIDKSAKPIKDILWNDFIDNICGTEWNPGANTPFDPIASAYAKNNGLNVICADGRDIKNTLLILEEKEYKGTLIHS